MILYAGFRNQKLQIFLILCCVTFDYLEHLNTLNFREVIESIEKTYYLVNLVSMLINLFYLSSCVYIGKI